jgi:hypothetical protein
LKVQLTTPEQLQDFVRHFTEHSLLCRVLRPLLIPALLKRIGLSLNCSGFQSVIGWFRRTGHACHVRQLWISLDTGKATDKRPMRVPAKAEKEFKLLVAVFHQVDECRVWLSSTNCSVYRKITPFLAKLPVTLLIIGPSQLHSERTKLSLTGPALCGLLKALPDMQRLRLESTCLPALAKLPATVSWLSLFDVPVAAPILEPLACFPNLTTITLGDAEFRTPLIDRLPTSLKRICIYSECLCVSGDIQALTRLHRLSQLSAFSYTAARADLSWSEWFEVLDAFPPQVERLLLQDPSSVLCYALEKCMLPELDALRGLVSLEAVASHGIVPQGWGDVQKAAARRGGVRTSLQCGPHSKPDRLGHTRSMVVAGVFEFGFA